MLRKHMQQGQITRKLYSITANQMKEKNLNQI